MATSKALAQNKVLDNQNKIQKQLMEEASQLKNEFSERLFTLLTSAFGLVAALAWNQVIQESINVYIKPFFGENSGLITLTIYAIVVTLVAVLITYNLSKLNKKK